MTEAGSSWKPSAGSNIRAVDSRRQRASHAGAAWRWMDDGMVWVRARGGIVADDREIDECDVLW